MSEILDKLTTLTPEELRELRARAGLLLQNSTASSGDSIDEEVLADVLADELRAKSIRVPVYGVLKRMHHYKAFHEAAPLVEAFTTAHVRPRTKAERRVAYTVFVRMVVRYMESARIPVSHKAACQQLRRVPEIVERQFPGYVENGLLRSIVSRLKA